MQYTLRNVPPELDSALRTKAKEEDKSLNQATLDVLLQVFGLRMEPAKKRDISFLIGSWDSDPEVEQALEDQRKIDPDLWS